VRCSFNYRTAGALLFQLSRQRRAALSIIAPQVRCSFNYRTAGALLFSIVAPQVRRL
jgi:hypothetical protein